MINYEGDKKVNINSREIKLSKELNGFIINIFCYELGNEDELGVNFSMVVWSVPNIGDCIFLQDGKQCKVVNVFIQLLHWKMGFCFQFLI